MAKYTVIADTSEKLVEILQRHMVPKMVPSANEIGLRSPQERGDVSLGLYLYDVRESEDIYQKGPVVDYRNRQSIPPVFLDLYYMVTAYSGGDVKFRMSQEEKLLGGVIRVFRDYPSIPLEEIDADRVSGVDLRIQLLRLSMDEKSKIWNFPGTESRLSLFYRVSPVTIDSSLSREIFRVTQVDMDVRQLPGGE